MKQKYLLSVFLLAVGIALSSCKASLGELRSGKLASRLPEGGWQLHEVWSLTEQGEKRKCLLGERIAITSEEMYTYPKVLAPYRRMVYAVGKNNKNRKSPPSKRLIVFNDSLPIP